VCVRVWGGGSNSTAVLLEFPLSVIQRADLPRLQPSRNAMEVKGVVAHTPCHHTLVARCRSLVRLALNAQVHDMVPADGAVVHHNICASKSAKHTRNEKDRVRQRATRPPPPYPRQEGKDGGLAKRRRNPRMGVGETEN
jgi:hypothetical protein